ncbi:MAG: hypothetical protein WC707_04070 [Candidatus Babeliaceae bacterium]|jgi:hypothetical protein
MKKIILTSVLFLSANAQEKFSLITTLYNEPRLERLLEFITCLEKNIAHDSIDDIHIAYDTTKDDSYNLLLHYLKIRPITIQYIQKRPTYGQLFDYAHQHAKNKNIILTNADIFFNHTLHLLDGIDLTNKFLAITRWQVQLDGAITFYTDNGSQDTWIFKTPLRKFQDSNIPLGICGCDNCIAYQAIQSGLEVYNPNLSLQCCHVHRSNLFTQEHGQVCPGPKQVVPMSKIYSHKNCPLELQISKENGYQELEKYKNQTPLERSYTMSKLYNGNNFAIADIITAELMIGQYQDQEFVKNIQNYSQRDYALWQGLISLGSEKYDLAYTHFRDAFENGLIHWRVQWYAYLALQHFNIKSLTHREKNVR